MITSPLNAAADRRVVIEPSPRRVRVRFGGETIADSRNVMLLLEQGHTPVYYFPRGDVRMDLLHPTQHTSHCPYKGDAVYWDVRAGGRVAENAAWAYPEPLEEQPLLADLIAFYWDRMDAWYEEDDEVFVHPRDPYKRVDVLRSSRHVRVEVAGEVVADTHRPSLLFETGLPVRYYIPQQDVRLERLSPTDSKTQCPYKGVARYWSVIAGGEEHRDLAWSYPFPVPECPKVEGLIAFYNERVDLFVDGERQERPKTRWS